MMARSELPIGHRSIYNILICRGMIACDGQCKWFGSSVMVSHSVTNFVHSWPEQLKQYHNRTYINNNNNTWYKKRGPKNINCADGRQVAIARSMTTIRHPANRTFFFADCASKQQSEWAICVDFSFYSIVCLCIMYHTLDSVLCVHCSCQLLLAANG